MFPSPGVPRSSKHQLRIRVRIPSLSYQGCSFWFSKRFKSLESGWLGGCRLQLNWWYADRSHLDSTHWNQPGSQVLDRNGNGVYKQAKYTGYNMEKKNQVQLTTTGRLISFKVCQNPNHLLIGSNLLKEWIHIGNTWKLPGRCVWLVQPPFIQTSQYWNPVYPCLQQRCFWFS